MKTDELFKEVRIELNSRNLKSNVRFNALSHIKEFVKKKYNNEISCFLQDKKSFKQEYEVFKCANINSAESSAINELYNQYRLHCHDLGNKMKPSSIDVKDEFVKSNESSGRNNSDEYYVIGLCNEVLKRTASQQHKFDFLLGDTNRRLPVDAYYEDLNLVIEYYERQHTESVALFDKKMTASGVDRATQRKIYDERRRQILPQHGIKLVIISYSDFGTNKKILRRHDSDLEIVKKILKNNGVL